MILSSMGFPCAEGKETLVIMAEVSMSVALYIHTWFLRIRDRFHWTEFSMGK